MIKNSSLKPTWPSSLIVAIDKKYDLDIQYLVKTKINNQMSNETWDILIALSIPIVN